MEAKRRPVFRALPGTIRTPGEVAEPKVDPHAFRHAQDAVLEPEGERKIEDYRVLERTPVVVPDAAGQESGIAGHVLLMRSVQGCLQVRPPPSPP